MSHFAIVIPNRNQSRFLSFALKSLRCQSVPFELAVMDAGSTDGFDEVVRRYSDVVTFWRSAPDGGQAFAIREGKERVSGDIVAWLNADDYYFPGAFEKVNACFENHPEVDVVYGDAVHVTPEGFFLSYFPHIQPFNADDLTHSNFICQPACFVRRPAYDKVGGIDPDLHYTMDWDLWCRLAKSKAHFFYLHEVLAAVRYYPGTKTLSRTRKRYMEIWQTERRYGHGLFPRTWLGTYFVDLSFQKRRSLAEGCIFSLLNHLKFLKRWLTKKNNLVNDPIKTNYGFHRWDSIVERRCTIHLPWYDHRAWKKLCLTVEPTNRGYQVMLNGKPTSSRFDVNGQLIIEVPELETPSRTIEIECMEQNQWKLIHFDAVTAS